MDTLSRDMGNDESRRGSAQCVRGCQTVGGGSRRDRPVLGYEPSAELTERVAAYERNRRQGQRDLLDTLWAGLQVVLGLSAVGLFAWAVAAEWAPLMRLLK